MKGYAIKYVKVDPDPDVNNEVLRSGLAGKRCTVVGTVSDIAQPELKALIPEGCYAGGFEFYEDGSMNIFIKSGNHIVGYLISRRDSDEVVWRSNEHDQDV